MRCTSSLARGSTKTATPIWRDCYASSIRLPTIKTLPLSSRTIRARADKIKSKLPMSAREPGAYQGRSMFICLPSQRRFQRAHCLGRLPLATTDHRLLYPVEVSDLRGCRRCEPEGTVRWLPSFNPVGQVLEAMPNEPIGKKQFVSDLHKQTDATKVQIAERIEERSQPV